MPSSHRFPSDLADLVYKELSGRLDNPPDIETLNELFLVLFYASLEKDEDQPALCHVVYLDPKNPDSGLNPDPTESRINHHPHDHWSVIPFGIPLDCSIANIVLTAVATDPNSSSLVVSPNRRGTLKIWGLIDQLNRYHDFTRHEFEGSPEMPGIFQASILDVGHVCATRDHKKIGELKDDALIRRSQDVLRRGPIRERLESSIELYVNAVAKECSFEESVEIDHWRSSLENDWIGALCRLLLRTRDFRHGGAYLITPSRSRRNLRINHRIHYDRLQKALIHRGVHRVLRDQFGEQIETSLQGEDGVVSPDLHRGWTAAGVGVSESDSEIDGALRFISNLSRVDGLVLMDPNLVVHGFRTEITLHAALKDVYISAGPHATEKSLRKLDIYQFGMRHRSMMRYCARKPGSIGFVISQEGVVRCITKLEDRLVLWENLRLQPVDFVDA